MSEEFAHGIARTTFNEPQVPVVANVTALPATSASQIRALLQAQTYSPVRWTSRWSTWPPTGCAAFIEIGPGKVLAA